MQHQGGTNRNQVQLISLENRITWSEKRAKKDKAERKEKIAKAQKMLDQPSNIEKKASRYFIKNTGEKKYTIDQQKIEQQVRFDGFKAIATNEKDITPNRLLKSIKTFIRNYNHKTKGSQKLQLLC